MESCLLNEAESIATRKKSLTQSIVLCLCSLIFQNRVLGADPVEPDRLRQDIVVVVPPSWKTSLTRWEDFRRKQGYRIEFVAPERTAEETRSAIEKLAKEKGSHVDFLFLAADAPDFLQAQKDRQSTDRVPAFYVESKVVIHFGSSPTIVTDDPYSDWNSTGARDTVVGRVPATTPQALADYCDRVIRYETGRSADRALKQIDIVAGVGGFGSVTDTVVESMSRQLLSEDVPSEYQLTMTYASPSSVYYPSPLMFNKTIIDQLSRGGLFWIYLGHGFVDTLDVIPFEDRLLPIFTKNHLDQLNGTGLPPIAIFLACYLGAFDASDGCLAEKMIMQPGGPIAAIAGSRVTMPYGMAVLGSGMLHANFQDQLLTVGEILNRAKQASLLESTSAPSTDQASISVGKSSMSRRELLDVLALSLSPADHDIASERLEHCYLFNLLGDPLLRISRPSVVEFNTPKSIESGEQISISGKSPMAGFCEIEIAYPRERIPDKAKELRIKLQSKAGNQELQHRLFESANDTIIARKAFSISEGAFQTEIATQDLPTGLVDLRVTVYAAERWCTKSSSIQIKKPRKQQ